MTKSKNVLLYERLHFASDSLALARHHAAFLIKKQWYFSAWEKRRRQATIAHQSAMATALVIAYTRPFTGSKGGWPRFPPSLLTYDVKELKLHQHMINMRNDVFAHTSGKRHSAQPLSMKGWGRVIDIRAAELVVPLDQLQLLLRMIEKVLKSIAIKRNELEKAIDFEAKPSRQG